MQLPVKLDKTGEKNVIRAIKTTNTALVNIFTALEVTKKVRLMFLIPKNSIKGKCYVCRGCCFRLLYLESKLEQDKYGWLIFRLECQKTVNGTNLETRKQQTRYRLCFLMLKCLRKCSNCVFALCQKTSKVRCMYLAFKNLQLSTKKGQQ